MCPLVKADRSTRVARFARWSNRLVTSPWAPVVALLLIGLGLYALPPLGVPPDRVGDILAEAEGLLSLPDVTRDTVSL